MKKIIPAALAVMALFAVSGCASSSPETSSEKSSTTPIVTPVMTPASLTEEISKKLPLAIMSDVDRRDAEDVLKNIKEGDEMCEHGTLNGKPITRERQVDLCIKLPGMKYMILEMIKIYS